MILGLEDVREGTLRQRAEVVAVLPGRPMQAVVDARIRTSLPLHVQGDACAGRLRPESVREGSLLQRAEDAAGLAGGTAQAAAQAAAGGAASAAALARALHLTMKPGCV